MKTTTIKSGVSFKLERIEDCKYISLVFSENIKHNAIGCYEGETIYCAFEYARKKKLPLVAWISSPGINITEGTPALMQMIKIANAIKKHGDKRLLYLAVLKDTTLGGTSASLVALADIIIAQKGIIYGFSGKKIIIDTTHEILDDDFQTAEFAMKHGMVDIIANKEDIQHLVFLLIKLHK